MIMLLNWLRRLRVLCRKELLAILKDPASRIVLVLPVIAQTILFGYAATFDLDEVPYAVLDDSHGATSTRILAKMDGSGIFRRVSTLRVPADIADCVSAGEALLVLHIPSDLESRLATGNTAPVQAILDGRNSTTASVALTYLNGIVESVNSERGAGQSLRLETRAWFNPNLETRWNIVPGLVATLSMMQVIMLAGLSVTREREQGTFDQLLVTPLSPPEILIGKALPPMFVGLVQATLILIVCRFWFGIPFAGSLKTLYACLTLFILSCVGIGLSISAVSRSMQQALVYTFVLIMPLILLSGLATPIANMPEALQLLTWINPLRFMLDCVRRIYLEGAVMADLVVNCVPMAVVAALTLPLAAWLFRNLD